MGLNQEVWGPHYWFVLQTMAIHYPLHPNDVCKKKYYDFIQNLPLFLPNTQIGNNLAKLIDKFPVTPYLESRLSFMKWVHFLHNKVNHELKKPVIPFYDALNKYYEQYRPKKQVKEKNYDFYYKIIIVILIIYIVYLYYKL